MTLHIDWFIVAFMASLRVVWPIVVAKRSILRMRMEFRLTRSAGGRPGLRRRLIILRKQIGALRRVMY